MLSSPALPFSAAGITLTKPGVPLPLPLGPYIAMGWLESNCETLGRWTTH